MLVRVLVNQTKLLEKEKLFLPTKGGVIAVNRLLIYSIKRQKKIYLKKSEKNNCDTRIFYLAKFKKISYLQNDKVFRKCHP